MPKAIYFNDWTQSYIPEILKEIYLDKIYDPILNGQKDLTIVDVGANIGLASLKFGRYGFVYSIEPCKDSFNCLIKTLDSNDIKYKAYNIALDNKCGKATLYQSNNSTMNSLCSTYTNGKNEEIEVWNFKKFFKEAGIKHVDFMKVDVEGTEFRLLCSQDFIDVSPMIDQLVIEIHQWSNQNPGQLYNFLKEQGYSVTKLNTEAHVIYAKR